MGVYGGMGGLTVFLAIVVYSVTRWCINDVKRCMRERRKARGVK